MYTFREENGAEARQAAYRARAQRVRGWARILMVCMLAWFLVAVWQTRAIAPPVHDLMQTAAGHARYAMDNTDKLRTRIRHALNPPSGTSVQAQHDPITSWLLKWTN